MPLPPSGALSLVQIAAEFGAPLPKSLTDFYRGGAWVPDIPQNAGVPTSGPMSITDFYGATNLPPVSITSQFITDFVIAPGAANASYTLSNTGQASRSPGGNIVGQWLVAGSAADFEVRATLQAGALDGGTTGVFLNLGTTRAWFVAQPGIGESSADLLVEIRPAGGGSVLDAATISLRATVDPG